MDIEKRIVKMARDALLQFIDSEIEYWKNIFDKRPKDRDLESDTVAQNFARIEIERLQAIKDSLK